MNFFKKNDIKKELTTSYTPQKNGVAERKNKTIVEMTRSIMKAKGLQNEFLGEVVATSIYLFNSCPKR